MRKIIQKTSMVILLAFISVGLVAPTFGEATEIVQVIESFSVRNTIESQLCEPLFEVIVDTLAVLRFEYTVVAHCSSIRLHIFLDDVLNQTTGWLGWPGAPAPFDVLPLSVMVDLSSVSGTHKIGLQAEGQVGGCNRGKLTSWGGKLAVTTSKHPATIDIRPGSDPNVIGAFDHGLLPVAILGSDVLDAFNIDSERITLVTVGLATRGSSKAPKLARSYEDVNNDGHTDLIAFFSVPELILEGAFSLETTSLTLTATLYDGTPIGGADSVRIVFPAPWLA